MSLKQAVKICKSIVDAGVSVYVSPHGTGTEICYRPAGSGDVVSVVDIDYRSIFQTACTLVGTDGNPAYSKVIGSPGLPHVHLHSCNSEVLGWYDCVEPETVLALLMFLSLLIAHGPTLNSREDVAALVELAAFAASNAETKP